MVKFLRRAWNEYSKLGKNRKKKQTWRKPTGRDNKMRDKRRGYGASVTIGYSSDKSTKGKIKEKTPILVNSLTELLQIDKNQIAILGKVGARKKLEMIKTAGEKNIEVANVNVKVVLKKLKRKETKK